MPSANYVRPDWVEKSLALQAFLATCPFPSPEEEEKRAAAGATGEEEEKDLWEEAEAEIEAEYQWEEDEEDFDYPANGFASPVAEVQHFEAYVFGRGSLWGPWVRHLKPEYQPPQFRAPEYSPPTYDYNYTPIPGVKSALKRTSSRDSSTVSLDTKSSDRSARSVSFAKKTSVATFEKDLPPCKLRKGCAAKRFATKVLQQVGGL